MIAIIKGCGSNIASIKLALERLDVQCVLTDDPNVIQRATHVILPGVGHAKKAMAALQRKKLINIICNLKQPVLGICLGMQLLYEKTAEGGVTCLKIIPGCVKTLPDSTPIIPHMGWNRLNIIKNENMIVKNISQNDFMYFVHSFAPEINEHTVAKTGCPAEFTSIVNYKNFYGVQFHPERSSTVGEKLLKNFLEMR